VFKDLTIYQYTKNYQNQLMCVKIRL